MPPPLTRYQKVELAMDKAWGATARAAEIPISHIEEIIGWDNIIMVCVWTIVCVTLWATASCLLRLARRLRLQRRGLVVVGEALQMGSKFVYTDAPGCVVKIATQGLIMDGFAGLAGRVENWLVMPTHVFRQARGDEGLLLEHPMKSDTKVPVKAYSVNSAIYSDVTYVRIPSEVWARLGVSKAPRPDTVREPVLATAWGHLGKTTGQCGRMDNAEYLFYAGSTVPGYSGAFYMSPSGSWLGMHLGAVTGKNTNLGARADMMLKEVKLCEEEYLAVNPEGYYHDAGTVATSSSTSQRSAKSKTQQRYDDDDNILADRLKTAYVPDDYAKREVAWREAGRATALTGKFSSWADELDDEALKSPAALIKHAFTILEGEDRRDLLAVLTSMVTAPSANIMVDTHAPGGGKSIIDSSCHVRVDKLIRRMERLEGRVATMADRIGMPLKPAKVSEQKKEKAPEEQVPVSKPEKLVETKVKPAEKPAEPKKSSVVPPPCEPSTSQQSAVVADNKICRICGKGHTTSTRRKFHEYYAHPEAMKLLRQKKAKDGALRQQGKRAVRIATEGQSFSDEEPDVQTRKGAFLGNPSQQKRKNSC